MGDLECFILRHKSETNLKHSSKSPHFFNQSETLLGLSLMGNGGGSKGIVSTAFVMASQLPVVSGM